jgi:hypothetical protein
MKLHQWQTRSALALALGMTANSLAPLSLVASAQTFAPPTAQSTTAPKTIAQLFPGSDYDRRVAIPAGTRLPVRYDQSTPLTVSATDPVAMTVVIPKNIRTSSGNLLIPAWSEVRGKWKPVNGGAQFFADELILTDGTSMFIDATSPIVATAEQQRTTNGDAVWKGAAIGAAGATVVSGVTGKKRITLGKVLLGAGAGALGGLVLGKKRTDVVTISPETEFELTLNSSLALRN